MDEDGQRGGGGGGGDVGESSVRVDAETENPRLTENVYSKHVL
jgi:hypothetical protein